MQSDSIYFCKHLFLTTVILLFVLLSASANLYAHGKLEAEPQALDITTFPPIEQDISALSQFGYPAQAAVKRLIERGDEILYLAHAALADPGATQAQRMQLMTALGEIGNTMSIAEIINNIEQMPNNRYLYQNALLALSNFSPTREIRTFVDRQLEKTKRDPLLQRSALNYYARQPDNAALRWVEKYALNEQSSPGVRYAALYMAGMNGIDAVKEPIAELLNDTANTVREYYLLLGFANVATMKEFNALVKNKNLKLDNVNKVREFLTFRLASEQEKKALASDLLNSDNVQLKQTVVKHLIAEKDADVLAPNWQRGDGVVRSAIKRAGFTVSIDEHGARLVETHKNNTSPLWLYLLIFAAIAGFTLLILRKKTSIT